MIMELAHCLLEEPNRSLMVPSGCCSRATKKSAAASITSTLKKLGASVCYTLDGGGAGDIDYETFSADLAIVTVRGVNIHPSIAKDRMVNAIRAAFGFCRQAAARHARARNHGRPAGLSASLSNRGRRRGGDDTNHPSRL